MCGEIFSHSIVLIIEVEDIVMLSLSACSDPRFSILFVSFCLPPPYCKYIDCIVSAKFGEFFESIYSLRALIIHFIEPVVLDSRDVYLRSNRTGSCCILLSRRGNGFRLEVYVLRS